MEAYFFSLIRFLGEIPKNKTAACVSRVKGFLVVHKDMAKKFYKETTLGFAECEGFIQKKRIRNNSNITYINL